MEDKTKKNLAKGIIAAGGVLSAAALHELLLSKEEHDRKEREINKAELEKDKYMKKIGAYEPFDVEKGNVTADDSKLVNLLTRAVGVAFTNNDVFARNKSNIRTFPFIISNNTSITASIEVELRKYYEVMVAAQVANLINHTVFAAENVLNVKDDRKRTVDKIMDQVFSRPEDLTDLGNSLQRGIYENVIFEREGEIFSLNEEYVNAYPTLDQYINDYQRIIRTYVSNTGEKAKLAKSMEEIKDTRNELVALKKNINGEIDWTLAANQTLTSAEAAIEQNLKAFLKGTLARDFDGIEDESVASSLRTPTLKDFNAFMPKYVKGKDIFDNITVYLTKLHDYHNMLSKGITILKNNNFSEPSRELADADPYFRLLDLPQVHDYDSTAELTMKMFRNSNALKVKLEMAAALLISTEILPFEFIEYATKYLGLPMHNKTKLAIAMKYGDGTERLPYRFMGNAYIISGKENATKDEVKSYKDNLLKFYRAMRPSELADSDELAKKLSKKQLRAGNFAYGFFDLLKGRKELEAKWSEKHKDSVDKKLAAVYVSSTKIDDIRKHRSIDKQILAQSARINGIDKVINSISTASNSSDMMYGKALSLLGAGGARVHQIIEDRLKNKIVDLFSVKDIDKSLAYFLDGPRADSNFDPTAVFTPNLTQTQKLMQSILGEDFEGDLPVTILTEDFILDVTDKILDESFAYNISQPTRTVTYKEVNKDPIEYILPAYTRGRSLLYGSTEIDMDQFKTRKVGEPIWIKVTFSDKINSMKIDMTDNDFSTVIGIKSEVNRVQEKDVAMLLKNPGSRSSELAPIFVDQRDQTLGLLSKIANENELSSASLNGILVISINEATTNIASKSSDDYINNPKLAVLLRKTYNLTSICLVDSIAEEYFIMEENSSSWSRLPFAELRASGSNNDLKAIASIIGRR